MKYDSNYNYNNTSFVAALGNIIGSVIGIAIGFFLNLIFFGIVWGVLFGVIGIVFGVLNGTFPDYVVITFADGVKVGALIALLVTFKNTVKMLGSI